MPENTVGGSDIALAWLADAVTQVRKGHSIQVNAGSDETGRSISLGFGDGKTYDTLIVAATTKDGRAAVVARRFTGTSGEPGNLQPQVDWLESLSR